MDWYDVRRVIFPRRMIDPDVHEEISFHIEEQVRELVARGWDEERAREDVLERFGDVASVEAACRSYDAQRVDGDSRRMTMDAWMRDVRLAARSLRKNAIFAVVVIVTLALGIGATTAVFSVVEGILLRPLPFDRGDRLAVVWQNDRATGTERENASTSDYYDYLERNRTFDDLAMYGLGTAVLTRPGGPPLQLNAASVSRNLADVLRLEMQLGRGFTVEEDQPGGPAVVVLTDRVWRDLYGADAGVVGRILSIDEMPHEVVGVLPAGIDYPAGETDVWVPIIEKARVLITVRRHLDCSARRPDAEEEREDHRLAAEVAQADRIFGERSDSGSSPGSAKSGAMSPTARSGRPERRRQPACPARTLPPAAAGRVLCASG